MGIRTSGNWGGPKRERSIQRLWIVFEMAGRSGATEEKEEAMYCSMEAMYPSISSREGIVVVVVVVVDGDAVVVVDETMIERE